MVPFLAWKSRKKEGLVSQNVSLYICYINYSDNLSFHCSRDLDICNY